MTSAFCYYGLVLMTTELFGSLPGECGVKEDKGNGEKNCRLECQLESSDYMDLLWTTLAEFPGIFCTIFAIEKIGRKVTMAGQLAVFAGCVCLLSKACILSRTFLTIAIFLARGLIAGVFQAAYVYTPEVYPTYLRSVGVGACSAMARLGAMLTPYIAQVLLQKSLPFAMGVYACAALLAAGATLALPIETKGRGMSDSSPSAN